MPQQAGDPYKREGIPISPCLPVLCNALLASGERTHDFPQVLVVTTLCTTPRPPVKPRLPLPVSTSTSLYYRVDGPVDASPLLLLHGGPGAHHDYLYPQMLDLASDHRIYTYDQRGGGQSRTDDPTPITWETHVDELGMLIDEFGLSQPTLVGYSWGALLAMLYAISATRNSVLPTPARLILISPAPITRAWRSQFEETLTLRSRDDRIQAMRASLAVSGLRERNPVAYRQRSFELSVAGYFHDPAKAVALTPFRVIGRIQQSVWDSLGDFDLRKDLCAIHCPALVVHGDADPIPLESARTAAESLGARLVILHACGHVPYVEQPEALFAAVRTFLSETEALISK